MEWLYRTGLGFYHRGIRVAARLGNVRAAKWVRGRRRDPQPQIERIRRSGRPIVWLHAASLGEYEQGRPVLQHLRNLRPDLAVVLTFYSPSGYERCQSTELAEVVAYLPADSARNASEWVAMLRPEFAIFVKYEFWFYHLSALRRAEVPTFLVAGSFHPNQPFFRWYGNWWREMLGCFTHICVQTSQDKLLLAEYGVTNVTVTGDPRIDRTLELVATPFTDERLDRFTAGHPTLIAGSVWPPDVDAIARAWPSLPQEWRLILAPHQLSEEEIMSWQSRFDADRYTGTETGRRVLILDAIGILSRVYRLGKVAYVGGGFKTGLHNTLEPMSYGLPVIFGPRYAKFPEAREAISRGGATSIRGAEDLTKVLQHLREEETYERSSEAQLAYAAENAGAGQRTARLILQLLMLLLVVSPLGAQSWSAANRLSATLDALYTKCNLMVAFSGSEWRPGMCIAAAEVATGATVSLQLNLQAGQKYTFIASGEGGTTDIDLAIRDAYGKVVASDTEADFTPIVDLTVGAAATYTLQLHLVGGRDTTSMTAVGMLMTSGTPIRDTDFRQVNRRFNAAAGAVRAAGGANRFADDANSWCLFGYLLGEGRGATIENLLLGPGNHFIAATTADEKQDIDLYLADDQFTLLSSDTDGDAYPMIEYRNTEPGPYKLRLEVEKAREPSLVLLGRFIN
ncbi:3-deoxy-D-manno-octulosonic-acid transferase [Lewinella aquimaris]|uniref:3-deoxy-D-manno-octulosonic acid transferase n=1 Tax=Neolewinella aquimaris TaxID=1835722 RepID=A0A840DZK4_9BACT|nr:glycosyltransferase N-terminal domain-containing protein [Neolewinella aquimaris]MBB4078704.1 3-deoxy-D-manno-octulosonic-acid transferase [Neolewinella aquimaris]